MRALPRPRGGFFFTGYCMSNRQENYEHILQDLWDIIDTAEALVKGREGSVSRDEADVPDFSAVAAMLAGSQETAPAAVTPEAEELELTGEPAAGEPAAEEPASELEQLPSYVEACRTLDEIAWKVLACRRCGLCEKRKKAVPGSGMMNPKVMIIGEAPGAEEDVQGEPFVGRAGKYLDSWMGAIKLFRGRDLFLANIVKCRPPGNRDPLPEEQQACLPYLKKQIRIIKPQTILCVGRIASQVITGKSEGIGRLRGGDYSYEGIPVVVTYHPSGVLRNPEYRAPVWDDLKRLSGLLHAISSS